MDNKKPIEILAEVLECSPDFVQKYSKRKTIHVPFPAVFEAMKIFGEQCWDAAKQKRNQLDKDGFCIYYGFDDYIQELEEQK